MMDVKDVLLFLNNEITRLEKVWEQGHLKDVSELTIDYGIVMAQITQLKYVQAYIEYELSLEEAYQKK